MRRILGAMRIPVAVQLNEQPSDITWLPDALSKWLSHLDTVGGALAISSSLSRWAQREADRIGQRVRIIEVPVSYHRRIGGESKHSANYFRISRTALRMLWAILRHRLTG